MANLTNPLGPLDFGVDQLATGRQALWRRRHQSANGFVVDYCVELDQEANNYLERHQAKQLTRRGVRELNWIYRYPWYSNGPLAPTLSYRFSSKAKSYRCFIIKLYDPARSLVGVLMLMAINGHLTVPYCCYDCDVNVIAQLVTEHIVALRLNGVTTYRLDLIDRLSTNGFPWVWRINRTRAWVLSDISENRDFSETIVQDGDGDLAFTL